MANLYVRSTDGSDADNGTTWALAKATLSGVTAIDANGDTIYVSQNHAESTTTTTIAPNGALNSPVRIICANDGAEPPTSTATTATVTTTTGDLNVDNSVGYSWFYGINFVVGSGSIATTSFKTTGGHSFESCNFTIASTGASSRIILQRVGVTYLSKYINCGFKFSASGQGFGTETTGGSSAIIQGGSILSGGTSPTVLFPALIGIADITVCGFDMSNASPTMHLCNSTGDGCRVKFINCKLPASWTGSLFNGTPNTTSIYEMFNCDSGNTNYHYRRAVKQGTIQDNTTNYMVGGATIDGTTYYSLTMASGTNVGYYSTLDTPQMVRWNTTLGSAITVTVEILHNSATNLKDNEIWLEVQYLGTSGNPLSTFINDSIATVFTTPADQAASSVSWVTTGLGTPNKQKLSVTFTPQMDGYIQATVKLAKPSYTVYVNPKMTVS